MEQSKVKYLLKKDLQGLVTLDEDQNGYLMENKFDTYVDMGYHKTQPNQIIPCFNIIE